ncbi:hypothetical protein RMO59_30280 [Streptomyces alfalfae]
MVAESGVATAAENVSGIGGRRPRTWRTKTPPPTDPHNAQTDHGEMMLPSADSSELAHKGLDGIPLWLLAGVAVAAFIIFGITQARKRR